jgi:hypothetical protein
MLRALLLACLLTLPAAAAPALDRVIVPALKTGIYIGSVTLTTAPFVRQGENYTSTYEAKVWPWSFWSETGGITITLSAADQARLARGETVTFAGEAANHKGKPRKVTGRAQPDNPESGRIKVRIHVDDVTLVFNGTYRWGD